MQGFCKQFHTFISHILFGKLPILLDRKHGIDKNITFLKYLEEETVLVSLGVLLFCDFITWSPDLYEGFNLDPSFSWSWQHALVVLLFFQRFLSCSPSSGMWCSLLILAYWRWFQNYIITQIAELQISFQSYDPCKSTHRFCWCFFPWVWAR